MPAPDTEYTTRHTVNVAAPAAALYAVIADAERWPVVFPPTVHVRRAAAGGDDEFLDLWAHAPGTVKSWRSRRELDPERRTVHFRQLVSAPPVASMSGIWRVETHPDGTATVILDHTYTAQDDDPEHVAWIERAIDAYSEQELAAVAAAARAAADGSVATFTFADSIEIAAPAQPIFDFLYRADLWPQRLPHVSRVALSYLDETQVLEMDTVTGTGEAHTTRSHRVRSGPFELAYKQDVLPAGFLGHHGRWTLAESGGSTVATSHHTARVDVEALRARLGAADRADVERRVRAALGGNSIRTLEAARDFAEAKRSVA
ncbi:aromatase/cyclase [Nocardia sp. NPDC050697]|uniref:aromatase/cyclase n=1 Tax=Nocardia sp. NPDC050697 TaxID=3155158 RepID=UPI00340F77FF